MLKTTALVPCLTQRKSLTHVKRNPTNTSTSCLKHCAFIQQLHIVSLCLGPGTGNRAAIQPKQTKLCPQGGHNNAGASVSSCTGPQRLCSPPREWGLHFTQGLVGHGKNFFSLRREVVTPPTIICLGKEEISRCNFTFKK